MTDSGLRPTHVGLTGGIASGKSTVSARLSELGAVVIDSDVLARQVVESGTSGLRAVVEAFGESVLAPDGALDRPALGRLVFADPEARTRLEAIIHPLVRQRSAELAAEAARAGAPVVVFDIPLLVETGQQGDFDHVVVVDANEDDQLDRLVSQRGMAPADVLARIRAQAGRERRRAAADHIVVNDGTVDELLRRVDALWPHLVRPEGV